MKETLHGYMKLQCYPFENYLQSHFNTNPATPGAMSFFQQQKKKKEKKMVATVPSMDLNIYTVQLFNYGFVMTQKCMHIAKFGFGCMVAY